MIYLNGQYINDSEAAISVSDRGFQLGDGLFETLLCKQGQPIALAAHWERLTAGAQFLQIPIPINVTTAQQHIDQLLHLSQLHHTTAALRITLTRGPAARGLTPPTVCEPTLLMQCFAYNNTLQKTLTTTISDITRNEKSLLSRYKTLNYLNAIVAKQRAQQAGFNEAILLNTSGLVVCASAANLFIEKDKQLHTPSIESGALPGVTRHALLQLAKTQQLPITEKNLSQQELRAADTVFITNSLIGIQLISRIDDVNFKPPTTDSLTAKLIECFDN